MAFERASILEAYRLFDVVANDHVLNAEEKTRFREHVVHRPSVVLSRPLHDLSVPERRHWLILAAHYNHHGLFHACLQHLQDSLDEPLLEECLVDRTSATYYEVDAAPWKENRVAILSDIIRLLHAKQFLLSEQLTSLIFLCVYHGIDFQTIDKRIVGWWFDIAFRSSPEEGPSFYARTLRNLMSFLEESRRTITHHCFSLLLKENDLAVTKEVFHTALERCCRNRTLWFPPDVWFFNRLVAERKEDLLRLDLQRDLLDFVDKHLDCDKEAKTSLLGQLRNLRSFSIVTKGMKRHAQHQSEKA